MRCPSVDHAAGSTTQTTCSSAKAMREETRPPMATGAVHWFNRRANDEVALDPKELRDSTVHHA